jgi:hypothetical protein
MSMMVGADAVKRLAASAENTFVANKLLGGIIVWDIA